MTIEEMRNAMTEYCENHVGGCECCEKHSIGFCEIYSFRGADDKIIKQWHKSFFPELYQATENKVTENITIHAAICDELKDLYMRKNTDYGDSFHKTFIEEGMAMSRIRLSDKLERFKRLTKSGEQNVKDESVRDTLIDLANYAIMTIVEMERVKND